ncbi:hypothetical protein ABH930_004459 [Kitasatospora sp. GAS204A]|nr:hypothetical protein [Kitasatospora sp. GAS204B]
MLGWRPGEDLIGPTLHASPHPADAAGRTEFRGIRDALTLALSEVLGAGGFTVVALGTELLVTAGRRGPGTTPALVGLASCRAPSRSRPVLAAAGAGRSPAS